VNILKYVFLRIFIKEADIKIILCSLRPFAGVHTRIPNIKRVFDHTFHSEKKKTLYRPIKEGL